MRPSSVALRCITEFDAPDLLHIQPWPDDVIDNLGFDPRSAYVERFWLGVLGPSTTWLLRRLVTGLEEHPDGYPLSLAETAQALGLSDRGARKSAFVRAVSRTIMFDLATPLGPEVLAVRRKLPPLNQRQVDRLPAALQSAHRHWQQDQLEMSSADALRRRARLLALSMIELGDEREGVENRLLALRFHPAMVHDAVDWAWGRHLTAWAAQAAHPSLANAG